MMILVLQLAVIITAARFFGWFVREKLHQSEVLGELASGMVIGPFLLGSLHIGILGSPLFPLTEGPIPVSPELYGIAVIGSILLLFVSGLETDLKTFIRFSGKASLVGLGGIILPFTVGNVSAVLFLPQVASMLDPPALFLGVISSATSVGITARILSEQRKLSSPEGVTVLSAAVFDDVLSILLLAVVVGMSRVASDGGMVDWAGIGFAAARAIGFWAVCTVGCIAIAPRITRSMKRFKSLGMVSSISLGLALLLSGLFEMSGLAMIIGAYITGLSFSQTDMAHEIQERIQGLSSFFVPVFFSVMGMMVNFSAMRNIWAFALLFSVLVSIAKLIGCGIPSLAAGFNLRGALRIGAGMMPRGEVALIIAGVGLASGAIEQDIFGVAVMTMLIASIAAPPILVRLFAGGSGYTRSLAGSQEEISSIELEFPGTRTADFMRERVLKAFRDEGFYISQPDHHRSLHTARNEEIAITIESDESRLIIRTKPEYEQFVRLLMMEELLVLKEFLASIETMKSPDMMGAQLLMNMFAREDTEKSLNRDEKVLPDAEDSPAADQ